MRAAMEINEKAIMNELKNVNPLKKSGKRFQIPQHGPV